MVHACQKTGKCASPSVEKIAKGISAKDAEDFAKTKHKGLPEKKKKKKGLKSFEEFMLLYGHNFSENLDAQNKGIASLLQMNPEEEEQLKSQSGQLISPFVRKMGILLSSLEQKLGGNNNQNGENTDQWHQQAVKLLYVAFKMAAAGGKKQWNDSMLRKNIQKGMNNKQQNQAQNNNQQPQNNNQPVQQQPQNNQPNQQAGKGPTPLNNL